MSAADAGPPQEGPNPLELFFEQNKKWIYALAVLLVVALAANYGWQILERARSNAEWRAVNDATGLSKKYAESVVLSPMQGQMQQLGFQAEMRDKEADTRKKEVEAQQTEVETVLAATRPDPNPQVVM